MTEELGTSPNKTTEDLKPSKNKWKNFKEAAPVTEPVLKEESEDKADALTEETQETPLEAAAMAQLEKASLNTEAYKALESEHQKVTQAIQYLKAELQNTARRHREECSSIRRYASANTIEMLFPLVDSLEAESKEEGRKNIIDLLYSILEKMDVKVIDPVPADPFDPHLHSAIAVEKAENSDQALDTIIKVVRKGYQLHDRILRPAMVVINGAQE